MTRHVIGDTTYRFACTHCGRCCTWKGDVHVSEEDIARLAASLDLSADEFIARYTRLAHHRRGLSLQDHEDHACVFLQDNRCSVYAARPEQCRRFPFPDTGPDDCPGLTPVSKGLEIE